MRTYFVNFLSDRRNEPVGCAVVEVSEDALFSPEVEEYLALVAQSAPSDSQEEQRWIAAVTAKCEETKCMPPFDEAGSMVALRLDNMDGFQKMSHWPLHKFLSVDELMDLGCIAVNAKLKNGVLEELTPAKSAWE